MSLCNLYNGWFDTGKARKNTKCAPTARGDESDWLADIQHEIECSHRKRG